VCKFVGSSPIKNKMGRVEYCNLIGDFGRVPAEESSFSDERIDEFRKNGPYVSVVEIPSFEGISTTHVMFSNKNKPENKPVIHLQMNLEPKSHL
jgi:hypothetical protein